MRIVHQLNVSSEAFFDVIEKSILNEIKSFTGKEIKADELSAGYEYERNMSGKISKGSIIVTILEYVKPTVYSANFKSAQGLNTLKYVITKIDDENIEVEYSEEFSSEKYLNQLNYKLLAPLYAWKNKKRVILLLNSIEAHIKNQREEEME